MFTILLTLVLTAAPAQLPVVSNYHDSHHFLAESARELTMRYGIAPLESVRLEDGDFEVRIWSSGFGTAGYIFGRRNDHWHAYILLEGTVEYLYGHPSVEVQPRCFEESILDALERTAVFDLTPEMSQCNGGPVMDDGSALLDCITVDGASLLVETRRGNQVRRNLYDSPPVDQSNAGSAFRALVILRQALGENGEVSFRTHPTPVGTDRIILVRTADVVEAHRVIEYIPGDDSGELIYLNTWFDLSTDPIESGEVERRTMSWSGMRPPEPRGERFSFVVRDDQLHVVLRAQPVDAPSQTTLTIVAGTRFDTLSEETLRSSDPVEPVFFPSQCQVRRELM